MSSVAAFSQCSPVVSGLVGWWPAASNANNIYLTNNGTLQGGATASSTGIVGTAFSFDGTNGYVQIPDSTILKPTNLTIEAWIRFTGLDSGGTGAPAGIQYIVFKQNTRSGDFEGFALTKVRVSGSDYFNFQVTSSAGVPADITSTSTVSTGVWYHVAAVRGSNFLQLYVNGALQAQTSVAFAQNYGTLPMYFGTTGQAFWDRRFRGLLDDPTLYNRALSSNEIAAIYSAGGAGKCRDVIITTQPQSQSVNAGATVNFTVAATGFSTLAYQWQLNSTNIPAATNAVLSLTNVQSVNGGSYRVIVTNIVNATTSAVAVLTISAPPAITTAPTNLTVLAGSNVTMAVVASGTAPLSYQWRKTGVNLVSQTNALLSLLNVTTGDEASYDVVVTNIAGSVTSSPPAVLTVLVPPSITTAPTNLTVLAGSNVTMAVVANGTAPLNYQWRKVGANLANQTNTTLALNGVTTGDAASYDVVVTNIAGSVTSSPPAVLTVLVPPSITTAPTNQTVLVGSNVTMAVVASGTAPLSYQWRKAGTSLLNQTNTTLSLNGVTTGDAASYDVVVTNIAGSVTSSPPAVLTVLVPPSITTAPTNQTVLTGSNVTMVVVANGTAPLNYQWRKAGTSLLNQTNTTLSLNGVTTGDAASYDVVVTNIAGSVTSSPSAVLTVLVPPSITTAPTNQTVLAGSNVSMAVVASGTAPLSYQWRKAGTSLLNQTNTTLVLNSVTTGDAASYDVVVTNIAGSVTSSPPAVLTVLVPPAITTAPTNQTVLTGSNVTMVVVANGTAPLNYQWRKAGTSLLNQTNITLVFNSVTTGDEASYDVVVTNIAGSVTSVPPAVLTVLVPPSITTAPTNQTVLAGSNVTMSVAASGTSPLSYQWRKTGVNLVSQTNAFLSLLNVTTGDAASYDVVVTNIAGSLTSSPPAVLAVLVPPSITTAPTNQTVLAGSNVTMAVVASGTAPLSYQWRKTGVNLASQTNALLSLLNVTTNNTGSYDVIVTNIAGSVTSSPPAVLTVLVPPFIVVAPTNQSSATGSNVTMVVSAGGTAPLSYQWRKAGANLSSQTNASLTLLNVTTNNSGSYDVVVANIAGSVTSSPPAVLTVVGPTNVPPFVTTAPQGETVLAGSTVNFLVAAGGTAPLSYQWRRNNQPLSGATLSSLQLVNVGTNNAGNYDVVITNVAGAVTSAPPAVLSVTPTINVAPFILSQPIQGIVGIGTDTGTFVVAGGTAPLSYQWRKNGAVMPGKDQWVLNLPSATTNDSGSYDVIVTNIAGSVTSAVAVITVRAVIDPALESAIACALGIAPANVGIAQLGGLTNLFARDRGITNLFGLHFATNLAVTDLSGNSFSDLSYLQGLRQLRSLELDQNRGAVQSLQPLSGLTNLTCLTLWAPGVTNYSPLSSLRKLTGLTIRQNGVTTLSPFAGLTNLTLLDLSHNNVTNVSALAGLTNLSHLDLRFNVLTNLGATWPGPTNLASLLLGGNSVSNLPSFQALKKLTLLNLDGNGVRNISSLTALTNVTYLSLQRNPVTNWSALSTMTQITGLELGGNGLTDISFLSGLHALRYLDLSYNAITNVTAIGGLTNLQSLALAGNPQLPFSGLSSMPALRNLWLQDNSISNASFVTSMPWLRHLDLAGNKITTVTPLLGITNLSGLALSRNALTNVSSLAVATNLTALRLANSCVTNMDFIVSLPMLSFFDCVENRVADISAFAALTNLHNLYLSRNRVSDIQPLAGLGKLAVADIGLNLVELDEESPNAAVFAALQCQDSGATVCACSGAAGSPTNYFRKGVSIVCKPHRTPPIVSAPSRWFMTADSVSTIEFSVTDDVITLDTIVVSGTSSAPTLLPSTNLSFGTSVGVRLMTMTPLTNQSGIASVTINAVNSAGLNTAVAVDVHVLTGLPVGTNMLAPGVTNLDPQFESAIRLAAGKPQGALTSVDLLRLTSLNAVDANLSTFNGWQWLTNLNTLNLSGAAVSDISFLTNLPQLTALSLNNTAVTNFSPVSTLTNLTTLSLHGPTVTSLGFVSPLTRLTLLAVLSTPISDISPLASLTSLDVALLASNRLQNISTLVSLPSLAYVDVRNNLLNLDGGTPAWAVIDNLITRAVEVDYLPQRAAPTIVLGNQWSIAANRSSWLFFQVLENGDDPIGTVVMGAKSSNTNLIPDNNLLVVRDPNEVDWYATVSPATNQTGSAVVTFSATNDVGLTSSTSVVVNVSMPAALNATYFGTPLLTWQTSGSATWFGQTNVQHDAHLTAQSGNIGNFGQSTLEASLIGPGTLTFWWKVSSEVDYDWLYFESSSQSNQISGEINWQQKVVQLAPESQTVRWRYAKDQNTVTGMDAGWLSDVTYVPNSWLKFPSTLGSGQIQMQLYGVPGQNFEIQTSTNLIHWSVFTTLTSTGSITTFIDATPHTEKKFYRARALP